MKDINPTLVLGEKNKEKTQIRHTETGFSLSVFHSRMLKDYFVDGLVQIAIVLSLLRTDLNNYININYVNYPEVQEIILGSSAAYTQTNFINNNFNSIYGRVHPKSVYNDVINDNLIEDLRSLTRFSSWQRSHSARQIATFLVGLNNLPEVARTPVEQTSTISNTETNTENSDLESGNGNTNTNQEVNDNEQYEEVIIGGDSNTSNTVLSSNAQDLGDIQFGELTREVIVHGIEICLCLHKNVAVI